MENLEILLRGLVAGVVLATGIALLRGPGRAAGRWTGALFCLSVAAFALHSGGGETCVIGPLVGPVWVLSVGGTAYFWMFAVTLFEDRPLTWPLWLPAAGMTIVGAVGAILPEPAARGVWVVHNLLEVALVLHVLRVIWLSWGGDLIEARRTLRGPFMAAVAVYCVILSGFEIAESLGYDAGWLSLAQAASLALITLAGAGSLLGARADLFEPPRRTVSGPAPDGIPARDRPALARLQTLMARGDVWRREGLTIGQLATEVGAPEHRLRRLINGGLGFRNFADFLNARRIEAARTALADPANAGASISALAFDLGYASLGPFNRAFKEATGLTPSAWRARTLSDSPQP